MGKGDGNIIKNSLPDDGFPIVESSNFRKDYLYGSLEIPILSNINFKIKEDCLSVEDPSCSGKNTPANHVGYHVGCFGCTKGYVVSGNDLNRTPYKELVDLFVDHWDMKRWFFHLFRTPHLNSLENTVYLTLDDSRIGIDPKRVSKELLEIMELSDYKHYRSRNFSRNKFQEISIAHALSNDPAILFLEETIETLDPTTKEA